MPSDERRKDIEDYLAGEDHRPPYSGWRPIVRELLDEIDELKALPPGDEIIKAAGRLVEAAQTAYTRSSTFNATLEAALAGMRALLDAAEAKPKGYEYVVDHLGRHVADDAIPRLAEAKLETCKYGKCVRALFRVCDECLDDAMKEVGMSAQDHADRLNRKPPPTHVDLGVAVVVIDGIKLVTRQEWDTPKKYESNDDWTLKVVYKNHHTYLAFKSEELRDAAYEKLVAAMRDKGMVAANGIAKK